MASDSVECSRCGATFESEDDLMAHSIDTHVGEPRSASQTEASTSTDNGVSQLDTETADRLLQKLEERATSGETVLVRYGQRFLITAGVVVLGIVVALTYLYATTMIGIGVYMFSLGTLFGLSISYLQAFLQSIRR